MKNEQLHKIALKMLDPSVARENKRLHPRLKEYLEEANQLCKNVGGVMVSRQAISCLILDWKNNNPTESPLLSKNKVV